MTDELSGRELDKALALAMGWRFQEGFGWFNENGDFHLPRYHESIDLLLRDVWPVAQARGARAYHAIGTASGSAALGSAAFVHMDAPPGVFAREAIDSHALALARALLAMLTEVKE